MTSNFYKNIVKEKSLVRQHLLSYNEFISKGMKDILFANNLIKSDLEPNFYLKYTDIRVSSPVIVEEMITRQIYPNECRNRDLSYSSPIFVDLEYILKGEVIKRKNVCIGKIPTMLRSDACNLEAKNKNFNYFTDLEKNIDNYIERKECPYDTGGYFIIKGSEKALLIQEQLAKNRMIKSEDCVSVVSYTVLRKSKTDVYCKKGCLYVKNNSFKEDILFPIILKAMNFSLKEALDICPEIEKSILETVNLKITSQKSALDFINRHTREDALNCLTNYLVPNIPIDNNFSFHRKSFYLCLMARKIFEHKKLKTGQQKFPDPYSRFATSNEILNTDNDNDFVGNKRYELSGQLFVLLFEDLLKFYNSNLQKALEKLFARDSRAQVVDPLTYMQLQTNMITIGFERAITTGKWNLKRFKMAKSGVTETMSRLSHCASVGVLSRVVSQFEKARKVAGPRALHTSSFGFLCPVDTPEGESCGLVKNIASLAEITPDEEFDQGILYQQGVSDLSLNLKVFDEENNFMSCVFLNGNIIGTTSSIFQIRNSLINMRREGLISKFTSVYFKGKDLYISSDNGRICRPLIVLKSFFELTEFSEEAFDNFVSLKLSRSKIDIVNKNPEITTEIKNSELKICELLNKIIEDFDFETLIEIGLIEYVDCNESLNILVAMEQNEITPVTTHMEISKAALLGYVASLIPYPDHNQSPRNTYQCSMGKQGIGLPFLNFNYRYDTYNKMSYFQKPLVTTEFNSLYNDNMCAGQNVMVAVMAFSGYDIEDAIVVNKSSIERGMFRIECRKTEKVELQKYPDGKKDYLGPYMKPSQSVNDKIFKTDGILEPGTIVNETSRLITKYVPEETGYKTESARCPFKENSQVESVILTRGQTDKLLIKSRVVQSRVLEVGDKLSSRHGQKGVVGKIVETKDMPFNQNGLSPDLIMNPHGFPSRMTVGKLLECITGKGAAIKGERKDSTVFTGGAYKEMIEVLKENNFKGSGKEIFTCGQTGMTLEAEIFFGPIFYQRLKHMVRDKIHARAKGGRTTITRQPTEGRSRKGGLRLGEMERDCLISYGVSRLVYERLMISSDEYRVNVCDECGIFVSASPKYYKCDYCKGEKCSYIKIPYACKVLIQEMMGMGVMTRLY